MPQSSGVTAISSPMDEDAGSRMKAALVAFQSGRHKSMRAAATAWNVKYSTLRNRIQGNHQAPQDAHEKQKLLSSHETSAVVDWCKFKALKGEPLSRLDLQHTVHSLCGKEPSKRWVATFLKTHAEELEARKPRALDPKRARAFNRTNVGSHFKLLKEVLTEYDVPPENIYNEDEKGVQLGGGRKGIATQYIFTKGAKDRYALRSDSLTNITVLEAVCANGTKVPPLVVLTNGAEPEGWWKCAGLGGVAYSQNGWTDDEVYLGWFRDVFLKHVSANNPSGKPILLITDGHKSHETDGVRKLATKNDIILYSLPPHTTHKLQPLDVAVFGPLQIAWALRCQKSGIERRPITRQTFVKEYLAVRETSMTTKVIQSAFKRCGIHPFDDQVFTDEDFGPSLSTSTAGGVVPDLWSGDLPSSPESAEMTPGEDQESQDSQASGGSPGARGRNDNNEEDDEEDQGEGENAEDDEHNDEDEDEEAEDEEAEAGMVEQQGDMDDNDPDYAPIVQDEPGVTLPNPKEPPPDSVGVKSPIPSLWDYRFLSPPSSMDTSSMTSSALTGSSGHRRHSYGFRSITQDKTRRLKLLNRRNSAAHSSASSSQPSGSGAFSSPMSIHDLPVENLSESLVSQINGMFLNMRAAQADAKVAQADARAVREENQLLREDSQASRAETQASRAHITLATMEIAHLRQLIEEGTKKHPAKRRKTHAGPRVITCPARAAQFEEEQRGREAQQAEEAAKKQELEAAARARELQRSHNAVLKTFEQPIAAYKHKDDLKDIAAAFALDQQGTIAQLTSRIKEYMTLHPELATNPHFQALFLKARRSRKRCASIGDSSVEVNPPPPALPPLPAVPPLPAHLPHARMARGSTPAHDRSFPEFGGVPLTRNPMYAGAPVHPGIPSPHMPYEDTARGLTPAHDRSYRELGSGVPLMRNPMYAGTPVLPGIPGIPLPHARSARGSTPAHDMAYPEFVPGSSSVPLTRNPGYTGLPPSSLPLTGFGPSQANPSSAYSMYPEASRRPDQSYDPSFWPYQHY